MKNNLAEKAGKLTKTFANNFEDDNSKPMSKSASVLQGGKSAVSLVRLWMQLRFISLI